MARSTFRAALAAMTLLAALQACATTFPAASRPTVPRRGGGSAALHPEVRELRRLVNEHRRRIGCPPLEWSSTLARVAQRHSADMARRGFFGHVNPDGEDPFERLHAAGVEYAAAAENVAAGHPDAVTVFAAWMRSRGHRRNIERCAFADHGIGLAENRWTHVFVRSHNSAR